MPLHPTSCHFPELFVPYRWPGGPADGTHTRGVFPRKHFRKIGRHLHDQRCVQQLAAFNVARGLAINADTARCHWGGERMDYNFAIDALCSQGGYP